MLNIVFYGKGKIYSDLQKGDVFLQNGRTYMVTNHKDEDYPDYYLSVDLVSGNMTRFEGDELVSKVECDLLIKSGEVT